MDKEDRKDRSLIGAAVGIFTVKWFIQTVAAWAFSQWLTKKWKAYKAKKESKKDGE